MACAMWKACRVFLMVYGGMSLALAARGGGGAGRRPPSSVGDLSPEHQRMCSSINNCTNWCSDCVDRRADQLFQDLDNCPIWQEQQTGYRYASKCFRSYSVCVCTTLDTPCKRCEYSEANNLLCFSQESDAIHVWPLSSELQSAMLLEKMCASCKCATNAPTTPKPPTTLPPMRTLHFGEGIKPRTVTTAAPTSTGSEKGPSNVVIIIVAVSGGALLILIIVCCVFCWRRHRAKPKRKNTEEEYANIDEMITLRSQGSMVSSQRLVSNEGLLPCGHRNLNNEMYGLHVIGNGSTLPPQPPTLPGNHPAPAAYQALNRGDSRLAAAGPAVGNGPCPHCRHLVAEKSATAPLLDRPAKLGTLEGTEGARNPYMALMKNNTCPTPSTPPGEPMCKCHARPLSECSSVAESLLSERHAGTADAPESTVSDQRPLSGSSDAQENPYYFKMETADQQPSPSPRSQEYFKLEDAQTLPLDTEISPLLSDPDNNGNNVLMKPVANDKDSSEMDSNTKLLNGLKKEPCQTNQSQGLVEPTGVGTAPSCGVDTPGRTTSLGAETRDAFPSGKHTTV